MDVVKGRCAVRQFARRPALSGFAAARWFSAVREKNFMPESLPTNTTLSHYRIVSHLGTGGMGEVYLAEDTKLGRRIALKLLPAHTIANADNLRRFEQEARAASSLNHPNIAHIYEIGESDNLHFIAMEYVEGKSLSDKIASRPLPITEIASIGAQIADALEEAHSKGITHRDIKSDNVMLDRRGRVKVLDFGLAKISQNTETAGSEDATQVKTNPGVVMGTVSYMSPEQSLGRETDARTDIWSLGVVLYEMATGKLPFTGNSLTEIIEQITHAQPEAIARFNYDVPPELEVIIKKTLRKKLEERYQTAHDIRVDLQSLARELDLTEHSIAPKRSVERKISSGNEQPTQTLTQKQTVGTSEAEPIHTTSSAEYIATEIKQHKRGFAIGIIILLLVAICLGYWFLANRYANTKQIESIAVMPFVNESGSADNEYLSDGMTESLINSLSQIPKLNVKARSSVFRYKGKEIDLKKIAQELNVQAILNGRVAQRGEQLILNLELVDAQTENVIWSEQYNRKQTDFVLLQNEIARDVSNKLRVKLSAADENRIAKNYTTNSEAYQLYLKGRYFLNQGTREGQIKSIEYFQQAVNLDPNFALGYAGMADVYTLLGTTFDASIKPREAMPKARIAAQRALEIDPNLSETHTSLAWIKYRFDWDWRGAEEEFKQAIALNPNNAQAHHWYADFLVAMGRFDESLAEIKRARELDPFSLLINWNVGRILFYARRYDEAIAEFNRTLELDQNSLRTHSFLERIYAAKGMNEEAFAEHLKNDSLTGFDAERITNLKEIYAATGWKAVWQKEIEWTLEDSKNRYVSPFGMALLYKSRGDKERAIEWLDKAFEERSGTLVTLKVDSSWDNLRDDPRFQDLLRRIGFPQ
ncbi:MAG: FlgO family outer membrane protein [Acidobacteriota bacterium]|nr:FlgO family outer membrane protein [Acidobacteriota bacterium]